jgi:uncharacterized Tic20 family protein
MKRNNENTNAFLVHISAFAGFIFPFGNIITPLIAWQTLKDRSTFLDEQGKEAVNFNISYTLYVFIITLFVGSFFVGNLFKNFNNFDNFNHLDIDFSTNDIFGFIGMALVIIAALKAKEGENYKYPFTIKFVK